MSNNYIENTLWLEKNNLESTDESAAYDRLNEINKRLDEELKNYNINNLNDIKSIDNYINKNKINYNQSFLQINSSSNNNDNENTNTNTKLLDISNNNNLKFNKDNYAKSQNYENNVLNKNYNDNKKVTNNNNRETNSDNNKNNQIDNKLNNLSYNDFYPNNLKTYDNQFPDIQPLETKLLDSNIEFIGKETKDVPLCVRREGFLKVRDADQKEKDVVVTYAILTRDRLSYFVNSKDESSIQGSIELDKIKESIKLINGFNSCFTIKTLDEISDCSICAESEDSAREWINAISQNAVNCNTFSALSNLNKRNMIN